MTQISPLGFQRFSDRFREKCDHIGFQKCQPCVMAVYEAKHVFKLGRTTKMLSTIISKAHFWERALPKLSKHSNGQIVIGIKYESIHWTREILQLSLTRIESRFCDSKSKAIQDSFRCSRSWSEKIVFRKTLIELNLSLTFVFWPFSRSLHWEICSQYALALINSGTCDKKSDTEKTLIKALESNKTKTVGTFKPSKVFNWRNRKKIAISDGSFFSLRRGYALVSHQ